MTEYLLSIEIPDKVKFTRKINIDRNREKYGHPMWAELSYQIGRYTEELFRDALHHDGLLEEYRAARGRKNYWTQK